jgi:hypothetical protein
MKVRIVAGKMRSEDAKIGGITPAVFVLSGRCEDWPPNTFLPTTLLGYWTGIFL